MYDKEKSRIAWFQLSEELEDFGLNVVKRFGVWHLELSNGDEFSKGTNLFYQFMGYFGIQNTAQLLDASPDKRNIIILARKLDLLYQ